MTYRLDDEGAFDRRRVGAGNEAVGAVDRAGQWCAHQLTDGIFPPDIALSIAPTKVWQKAMLHKLLEQLPTGEYRVVDFLQWNWSAEKVQAQRAADVRRKTKQRTSVRHAVTPAVNLSGHPPGEQCGITASGQGTGLLGSGSDPEGVQGEPPPSETVPVATVTPIRPPAPGEPEPDDPQKSAEELAIAWQIKKHAVLRPIQAYEVAPHILGFMMAQGQKLEWVLTAIDELAAKVAGQGFGGPALQSMLVGFCKAARAPKKPAEDPKAPPKYRERIEPWEGEKYDPARAAEAAKLVAGIGRGGA